MEKQEQDMPEVQKTSEEEVETTTEETVEPLTAEEIAELKKKADVSSQNYERAKKAEQAKKELELKIAQLEEQTTADDFDDDSVVSKKLAELNAKLTSIEEKTQLDTLYGAYPALKDKQQEFEEFKDEYRGVPAEKVAKLFLSENGLLEKTEKRKGLEKAGGGTRTVPQNGKMNADDVKRLRENNFKEYRRLVLEGKIAV